MKPQTQYRIVAAVAALVLAPAALAGLLVTDVGGKAEIDGKGLLQLMAEVPDGATIVVSAGASLVAVDLGNGREYAIRSPGRYLVEKGNLRSLGGGKVDSSSLPARQMPDVKIASARVAQATLVMRSVKKAAPAAASPVNTAVLNVTPTLRWPEVAGATGYRLVVNDSVSGSKLVDVAVAAAPTLTLTANAGLRPGGRYAWRATALRDQQALAESGGEFSVLGAAEAARLDAFRPQPGSEFSRIALYAALLMEAGANEEARLLWQALRAERPQDPALGRLAE